MKSSLAPEEAEDLLASTCIPRQTDLFSPRGSAPTQGNIVVLIGQKDDAVHVRVVAIDEGGIIQVLGQCPVPMVPSQVRRILSVNVEQK